MRIGLDVGTTAVKAAAFAADGELIARARGSLPPVVTDGPRATQDVRGVVESATGILVELLATLARDSAGPVRFVALTTQRDTVVVVDGDSVPVSDLVSWRDRRWLTAPSLWDALAAEGEEPPVAVRSLTSLLTEAWTGHAAESAATLPRDLRGSPRERLRALAGHAVDLPDMLPVGASVGVLRLPAARSAPLHVTSGDKNCELLGGGVRGPEVAGLSLGTAISLGTLVGEAGALAVSTEDAAPGVVRTPAALAGRWNVEVGLIGAWDALALAEGIADGEGPASQLNTDVFCVPYFDGALDAPGARPAFAGLTLETDPRTLLQAWAQGVVGELRRMRPALERAAGETLARVVLSGGNAAPRGWAGLVASGLSLPVFTTGDAWAGARGAVLAVLEACGEPAAPEAPVESDRGPVVRPSGSPVLAMEYYKAWDRLASEARAAGVGA